LDPLHATHLKQLRLIGLPCLSADSKGERTSTASTLRSGNRSPFYVHEDIVPREVGDLQSTETTPLDYSQSFICHTATHNSVRFWVESRTRLFDREGYTDFLQCASCKSEHTFAPENLFLEDNYDFLPVFGGDELIVFRRPAGLSNRYREIAGVDDYWGPPIYRLAEPRDFRELDTWKDIYDATMEGLPIVSQTCIRDPGTDMEAVIECPVKTMNLDPDREMYQVDTGPVCYPDLSKRHDPRIACLSLAFVAFNSPSSADFIVEQPTRVPGKGGEGCWIYHYTKPFSVEAENRIFSIGVP